MSDAVLVIGESGVGKSSSIRTLNPKETFIINVINKPLPFRGFKKNYFNATKENPLGNHYASDNYEKIIDAINYVNNKREEINTIVIDDFQYVMANEYMRRCTEKGWDKFTEIGDHAMKILDLIKHCRDNLIIFVLSHSELKDDGVIKCKTIGKMLDQYISVDGIFSMELHAIMHEGVYKFLTQHDGSRMAKTPMGMFETKWIDNDLLFVKQKMNEYFNQDIDMKIKE